jgi:4-amino-4-deoxy-L-arabinose transferase-like glycosyltransferase
MSFDTRLSPSRVTAAAASEFPRWALFALLVIYIGAGLFGRDPWSGDGALGLGIIASMVEGGSTAWWLPNAVGEWIAEEGPLPFWVGAIFVHLLGDLLGDAQAARLSCIVWFALATTALWYATYRLARRTEAQPVTFAFGGEAQPRDYGRMLADISVLLFLGTLGIVVRLHEVNAEPAAMAFTALALYGLALALDSPRRGALVAGIAVGALALSRGPWIALWLLAAALVAFRTIVPHGGRRNALLLAASAIAVAAIWPAGMLTTPLQAREEFFDAWLFNARRTLDWPQPASLGWIAQNFVWYCWPLWPLAAWTLFSWRHALRLPHIAVPLMVFTAFLPPMLVQSPVSDSSLILLIPPMVLLAAFGATSLRRSLDNLVDWLAIATFSLFALAAWMYFVAMTAGTPPKMAASVFRLVPGFSAEVRPLAVALAAAASIGWLVFAVWRIARRPPMLWRGAALAASGLTMLWLLVVTLFLPAVNYNRTYAPLAAEVRRQIDNLSPGSTCVEGYRMSAAVKSLFAYHGGVRFAPPDSASPCDLMLHRDLRRTQLDDGPPPGTWVEHWQGGWAARPDEVFKLYRRGG